MANTVYFESVGTLLPMGCELNPRKYYLAKGIVFSISQRGGVKACVKSAQSSHESVPPRVHMNGIR